jgi:hypothetical protein
MFSFFVFLSFCDSGRDKNGYYHELFLRGKRSIAEKILRIKIKGTGARKPSSPETEPNFYFAPFLSAEEGGKVNPRAIISPSLASLANHAMVSSAASGINSGLNFRHFAAAPRGYPPRGYPPLQSSLHHSIFESSQRLPHDASQPPRLAFMLAAQRAQIPNNRQMYARMPPLDVMLARRNNALTALLGFTLPRRTDVDIVHEIHQKTKK